MHKLQVENPEQIVYNNSLLILTVLGGVKLEGLDRLRVTLKIELPDSPQPPLRHNLDLYNDTQVEKLVRRTAERLEAGTSVIAASLAELTEQLELYRLQEIKQQATEPQAKPLTEGEQQTAIENMQAANLMEQTIQDLQGAGIQGEQENSVILYIAMTSRKCHDPLSVICLAKSGMGKSYLMEKVANCIPDADKKEHTQFSGNSFYYFKREEIRGKVFLIEDLDGAQEVLFPIRELQTKKRISKTVTIKDKNGQLRTVTLIVEGPVSVIGCTTKEKVYEDNANRAILIYIDSSKEQDKRIMDYQKRLRAGHIDYTREHATAHKLQNMQKVLQPVRVVNPYATLIELPQEMFKPRRTLPLLLSFIEAITFYHQHQRELKAEPSTAEVYIETTPQDIEWAFKLLKETLFRKSDELSGSLREFYEWLRSWAKEHHIEKFYGNDIRKHSRINPRTLQRYLSELTEFGRIAFLGGSKYKAGYQYSIDTEQPEEQLQANIDKQIRETLQKVAEAHSQRQEPAPPATKKSATVRQRATKPTLAHPNPPQGTVTA
jgi:DNA primase